MGILVIWPETPAGPDKEEAVSAPQDMWRCPGNNCGYIYDPDRGDRKGKIPKGTPFENLPEDWKCPVCGVSKQKFVRCAE